ncbi:MAG: 3,8-cyclase [Clostridia bacterium]|nr:3,8-cyclase [Clostridia bacterium]
MRDNFNRQIDYLRLSITDRCNLRCRYCMPAQGVPLKAQNEILRLEELVTLAQAALKAGIRKIRLTGGEPLVRRNVVSLVRSLHALTGLEEISLTTNGILLPALATPLKEAGLVRVNVSLDTLKPERYAYITRGGNLHEVWRGLRAALAAGLEPVKVNVVVMRGFNEDEILDFARLAVEQPLHVRFIEVMPIGMAAAARLDYVPVAEIRARVEAFYPLQPAPGVKGNGPAVNFTFRDGRGSIGFIGAMSEHFCPRCNRLRLTADGRLRPCLYGDEEIDLRGPLRRGASLEELVALFRQGILCKPQRHHLESEGRRQGLMSQIGG